MNVKRLAAWALLLILSASGICLAEESGSGAMLKDPDLFYEEHVDEAVPYADSRFFDVSYGVYDDAQTETGRDELRGLLFVLVVENGGEQTCSDFKMTAHLNPRLQAALAVSDWYNEPFDLYGKEGDKVPFGIDYTWQALLDLRSVAQLGGLETRDYYDMLIELTWKGGGELLRVSGDDIQAALDGQAGEADSARVDDALAEEINRLAAAYR